MTNSNDEVFFEPHNLDRDKMLVDDDVSDFLWCLHCERTYKRGKFRLRGDLQLCPYSNCDGDTVIDAWDWDSLHDTHANYPEIPEEGVRYPLYPDEYPNDHTPKS